MQAGWTHAAKVLNCELTPMAPSGRHRAFSSRLKHAPMQRPICSTVARPVSVWSKPAICTMPARKKRRRTKPRRAMTRPRSPSRCRSRTMRSRAMVPPMSKPAGSPNWHSRTWCWPAPPASKPPASSAPTSPVSSTRRSRAASTRASPAATACWAWPCRPSSSLQRKRASRSSRPRPTSTSRR
ncbi:hypothetical protein D3C71_1654770 [compost metagenome]